MNRRNRRTTMTHCACAIVLLAGMTTATAAERPNVLLVFVDNVGFGDLSCYGHPRVQTPHIDRLASEGVRCTDFYIGSPSCSPSRGAILTGRHPLRNGLNHQLSPQENLSGIGLPHSERILPQFVKPLGYATGAFGKWNIGFAPGSRPTDRGFDEFLGHASGNIHYFKHLYHGQNDLRRGTEPVDMRGRYATDLFADATIDFIQRHRDQPWLVYLAFNAAHFVSAVNVEEGEQAQWQVPEEYLELYGSSDSTADEQTRFLAVMTALDRAVGRVLATLDELQLRNHTLVMFISDNGAFMLPQRGQEVQSNAPLRDGGVTTYEGGVRVPAIFRWPGKLPAGTECREMLSSLDVLPLVLNVSGAERPVDLVLDGHNPLPALRGEAPSPHDALFWVWNQGRSQQWRAIREGHWKLVRRTLESDWELYDLQTDVAESTDLAAQFPDRVKSMEAKFEQWVSGASGK